MKKSYQFVFAESDDKIEKFLDAQPYKNLAFRIMVYDYIRRYGYTDIVMTLLDPSNRVDSQQKAKVDGQSKQSTVKRGRGRPRKTQPVEQVEVAPVPKVEQDNREIASVTSVSQDVDERKDRVLDEGFVKPVTESPIEVLREQEEKIAGWTIPSEYSSPSFSSGDSNASDDTHEGRDVYEELNDDQSGALDPFTLFQNQ